MGDAQYANDEYNNQIGWGHSAIGHAVAFAALVRARRLIGFHHDPWRDDDTLDSLYATVNRAGVDLTPAREGMTLTVASTV